ncbi:ferrous iron transport protein A [bacterium]|nr:ferrous iron transport protein A [bacterium]MBU1675471.1 ferrous iron transport protein A [bacterium]
MTLDTLQAGASAKLLDIDPCNGLRLRLMEMGLTPGADVSVLRVAPFGDPIEILVRGTRLSIRKREAALIRCRTT